MQRLETHESAALVLQLEPGLPQFGGQSAGKIRDRQIGKEVGEHHRLQRLEVAARAHLERRYLFEVRELQQRSEQNERDRGCEKRPIARQQDAGNNDDQRIEEIEERINAPGHVDNGRGKREVGEYLGYRLQFVFLPQREQHNKEK